MTSGSDRPAASLARLLDVMARLRDPVDGCPWDLAQTSASIAPYAIEEAYEVVDAIERGDMADLRDELGDLLLQVVFHARMAQESGAFDFADVAQAIVDKMERRHPHVFAAATDDPPAGDWEALKAQERAAKGAGLAGVLDDVPAGLPALTRAAKLTRRAARVGFDWPDLAQVMAKLREETAELQAEIDAGDMEAARAELGDLLFVCANLARKLDVDPEAALRDTNAKFVRRFAHVEAALAAEGRSPDRSTLAEMDRLWDAAKALEKTSPSEERAGPGVTARRPTPPA